MRKPARISGRVACVCHALAADTPPVSVRVLRSYAWLLNCPVAGHVATAFVHETKPVRTTQRDVVQ